MPKIGIRIFFFFNTRFQTITLKETLDRETFETDKSRLNTENT